MRRKHRRKNQKKIIIFSMIGLVCMFSIGYAAFSSEFLISGKGTIIQKEGSLTSESLKSLAVTSGDGLYADTYEEGRYIYRGKNVDNYIYFGTSSNELWRIISIETDGTLKIIKDEVIPDNANVTAMAYDTANARTTEKNTYCTNPALGCGVFAAIDGIFSTPSGTSSGTVTEDSTIKTYLNGEYYASLSSLYIPYIQSHTFYIGAVEYLDVSGGDTIEKNIAGEKMYTWTGNIGLINVTDVLKASTNSACTSATEQVNQGNNGVSVCNDSWLFTGVEIDYWTINATAIESGDYYTVYAWGVGDYAEFGGPGYAFAYYPTGVGVRPVLYLKSNITLKGSGTDEEPYEIQL